MAKNFFCINFFHTIFNEYWDHEVKNENYFFHPLSISQNLDKIIIYLIVNQNYLHDPVISESFTPSAC